MLPDLKDWRHAVQCTEATLWCKKSYLTGFTPLESHFQGAKETNVWAKALEDDYGTDANNEKQNMEGQMEQLQVEW